MTWVRHAKISLLFVCFVYAGNCMAAVIAPGVKLHVSKVRMEKNKTFFKHKNRQFVYPASLNIGVHPNKKKEIFLTFDELKTLLRENKIALGGVAGGGGGK